MGSIWPSDFAHFLPPMVRQNLPAGYDPVVPAQPKPPADGQDCELLRCALAAGVLLIFPKFHKSFFVPVENFIDIGPPDLGATVRQGNRRDTSAPYPIAYSLRVQTQRLSGLRWC